MISIRVLLFACAMSIALVHAQQYDDYSSCYDIVYYGLGGKSGLRSSKLQVDPSKIKITKVDFTQKNAINRYSTSKVEQPPKGLKVPKGRDKTRVRRSSGYTLCDDSTMPYGIEHRNHIYINNSERSQYANSDRPGWTGPERPEFSDNCGKSLQLAYAGAPTSNTPNNLYTMDYIIVGFFTPPDGLDSPCTYVSTKDRPAYYRGVYWDPYAVSYSNLS